MSDYYQGKTAVITGGASGVGRSIAFGLGRAGANVVIGDVDARQWKRLPPIFQRRISRIGLSAAM